jgi:hypothetical protein
MLVHVRVDEDFAADPRLIQGATPLSVTSRDWAPCFKGRSSTAVISKSDAEDRAVFLGMARTMERTDMTKLTTTALAAVLLPGMAVLPPAIAAGPAGVEQQGGVARTHDTALTPKLTIETLRGVVESIDQGNDTIKIRLSPETIELLRVQDGLVFNAVRYGDEVEVTIQIIAGAKTIVGLVKE